MRVASLLCDCNALKERERERNAAGCCQKSIIQISPRCCCRDAMQQRFIRNEGQQCRQQSTFACAEQLLPKAAAGREAPHSPN